MTGPERDSDVDAWLQTRRSLLRNSDDARALEPPPELDQRVIDRARRELRAAQADKPGFFRGSRFTMPFAIAATVVLSFSLVLEFNRYENGREALRAHADNSSASPITLTAPITALPQSTAMNSEPARTSVAPAAAPRAQARAERAAVTRSRRDVQTMSADTLSDKDEGRLLGAAAPAEAEAPAEARAPAAAPPVVAQAAAAAARASAKAAPPEQSVAAPTANAAVAAAGASESAGASADAAPRSAAQWWLVVEQLQRAGRKSAAEAELKALLKAYPDFVVPAEQAEPQQ